LHPEAASQVILEGNACHAYMDIEFAVPVNPGLDGHAMTRARAAVRVFFSSINVTLVPDHHLAVCSFYGQALQVAFIAPNSPVYLRGTFSNAINTLAAALPPSKGIYSI
jgi:hypothetical protein